MSHSKLSDVALIPHCQLHCCLHHWKLVASTPKQGHTRAPVHPQCKAHSASHTQPRPLTALSRVHTVAHKHVPALTAQKESETSAAAAAGEINMPRKCVLQHAHTHTHARAQTHMCVHMHRQSHTHTHTVHLQRKEGDLSSRRCDERAQRP